MLKFVPTPLPEDGLIELPTFKFPEDMAEGENIEGREDKYFMSDLCDVPWEELESLKAILEPSPTTPARERG